MSGGKGGKQTSSVQIPKWLEEAAQSNIARANEIAKIGYVPYFGPDVAAFSPMQQAAFANTGAAANAFGMVAPTDPMAGMPAPQTFAGGVQGYSSAPMYQQALAQLQQANPAQYAALVAPFIDPQTGVQPLTPFDGGRPAPPGGGGMGGMGGKGGARPPHWTDGRRDGGGDNDRTSAYSGGRGGGYTSFADMFDGGGPGASGGAFSGGGWLSDVANAVTGRK
jgi:hypothetical protein